MPRYAKRTDANQAEIVRLLNEVPGVKAYVLHDPVDILVGAFARNFLFEIKTEKKLGRPSSYTKKQREFMPTWPGQVRAVSTFEEILQVITEAYR